ncbi:MAG: glycosyl transferase family 1 [Herpetosiphonaceae bacterium]|nr:MAG: glycosyl transferase family 1 [Herpetosiphonaceae bacterium]
MTAPFIEEIAAGLVQRGHEVHVVAPYEPEVRRGPVERGVFLHFYRYAPHPGLNIWGYASSLKADVGIKKRVVLAAPLALSAGLLALLQLTAQAGFDLVHAHWAIPNGPPALLAAQLRGLPLVVSLHGSDIYLAERMLPGALVAWATLRRAAVVTACSGDLAARSVGLGGPPGRTRVLPYGVDQHCFCPDPAAGLDFRRRYGLPQDAPLIIAWGRMVYKKGFGFLIEAMPGIRKRYPEALLLLAGYGDLEEALRARASQLGLDGAVVFPGPIRRDELPAMINAADVVAVPSVHDQHGNVDGLPNVLLEAMACGRPIVASAVAGIPSVIECERHGLLVPEGDATALAEASLRLLDDRALGRRLGAAARRRIEEELNWTAYAERLEHIYESVLESNRHHAT